MFTSSTPSNAKPRSTGVRQQECGDALGAQGRLGVAHAHGGDHRAIEQLHEVRGVLVGVAGLAQERREIVLETRLVLCGGAVCGVLAVGHLGHGVDEPATAVALGLHAQRERIEHGERAIVRVRGQSRDLALEPREHPLVAALHAGQHEAVLGLEVPVEAHPGHVGLLDDRVDADGAHAFAIEQLAGHLEDPLTHCAHGVLPPVSEHGIDRSVSLQLP
jgi:hypothetical protein